MNYEFELKHIEPTRVAYMKYIGHATKANKVFPNIFKAIMGKANGAPLCNYLSMNHETKIGEIEVCVPTEITPNKIGVEVKELPRIQALCVTHVGSYETLFQAYEAMETYAKQNNLRFVSTSREVFIKGPKMLFKGNPNTYITEVQIPILEEE